MPSASPGIQRFAPVFIRLAMGAVFLWFAMAQLQNPSGWVSYLPEFLQKLTFISPVTIILLNGVFELLAGTFLIIGMYIRVSAILLGVHLFGIAFAMGMTAIGVRDFGLSFVTIAVGIAGNDFFSLDGFLERKGWLMTSTWANYFYRLLQLAIAVGVSFYAFYIFETASIAPGIINEGSTQILGGSSGTSSDMPITLSLDTVSKHITKNDCWIVVDNKIYTVGAYAPFHPGGEDRISSMCGKDATVAFKTKGGIGNDHSSGARTTLEKYYVGTIGQTIGGNKPVPATPTTPTISAGGTTTTPAIKPVIPSKSVVVTPPKPTSTPVPATGLTASVVATHKTQSNCWIIVSGKVYNVTAYINFHPGGANVIIGQCGKDATVAFNTKGGGGTHSTSAKNLLAGYLVGTLGSTVVPPTTPPVVDTTAPTVTISTPVNNATVTNTITISATATDTKGVAGVVFTIDGDNIGSDMMSPYSVTLNTKSYTNGNHTIKAEASDISGNKASKSITIKINNAVVATGITAATVATHKTSSNCWIIVSGKVYDVTSYISIHPGGTSTIINQCGKDATNAFNTKGGTGGSHSSSAKSTLTGFYLGDLSGATVTDTTNPTLTISAPTNGATVAAAVTFSATASDASGVANVVFSMDGATLATDTSSPYSTSINTLLETNGSHTLTAKATDTNGNTTTKSVTVTISNTGPQDTTPPVVSITAPASGATISDTASISATATDVGGMTSVTFKIDGATIATDTVSPYTTSFNTVSYTNGSHTLTAVATDTSGNTATATRTVTISNTGGTYTTAQVATHASVSNCWFIISGKVYDVTSYISVHPGGTSTIINQCGTDATTAFNTKGGGGTHSTSAKSILNTFYIGDLAGAPPSDTTAPSAPTVTATGTTQTITNLSWTASTDNVGVTGYNIYQDGGLWDIATGTSMQITGLTPSTTYIFTVKAKDAAGNMSAPSNALSVTTTAPPSDTTPPTVSFTTPTNGATISGAATTLSATATDASGVASVVFKIDGTAIATVTTAPYTTSLNTTSYTNGSHTLTAVATDTKANSATATLSIIVSNTVTDSTPPSVPTGLSATAISSSVINLSWTASTDNVGVTEYRIYRGGVQIATSTTTSYSNTGLSAGTPYSYTVAAYDAAGNNSAQSTAASATTQNAADVTAPTTPTNLTATATSSSQINLSWTASTDAVGVTGYKIYRGGTYLATSTTTLYNNTGLTASTAYTYTVAAYDAAGNNSAQSSSATATTQAPAGDATPPSAPTGLASSSITQTSAVISWTASTDNVGVTGYDIYKNGSLAGSSAGTSYTASGLTASTTYSFTVKAKDAAGNISASSTALSVVTIAAPDTTPPTVSFTAPTNGATILGTAAVLTATATDAGGIASVVFKIDGTAIITDTTTPYTTTLNTTSYTNGNHTLTATATDTNANIATATITVSINNPVADATAPSVPTNLSATATSSSQINLSWTASTDNVAVTGYKIYRGGVFLTNNTGTTYSNTGLTASTAYSYTVAAYDAANNNSAQSTSASATTQAAISGYTAAQVATHATAADCWFIVTVTGSTAKVYDVDSYINSHPGGKNAISSRCGQNASTAFNNQGHSNNAKNILNGLFIGNLIP